MKAIFNKKLWIGLIAVSACLGLSNNPVAAQDAPAETTTLKQGDQVPDFTLMDQDGKPFKLGKYVGKKKLVIFFYPKDESPVCTKEACAFRDAYAKYTEANALVIGINNGTAASHKAFAEKEHLPFTLLSDPDNKVLKLFKVREQDFGNNVKVSGRETFVIGLDGTVAYSFRDFMKGDEHSKQVLAYLNGK
ncbi:redoxin domain-containing protein [Fulvivirgaceae bacterium PWU5]|uniref:thioredoxin-dependent peroxiredoxin n=1 Tax=Dawidia cretensis TaxID=2782350 RepID=A0AAP2E4E0_9BACT|nr:redoxin domain-containing protein [Dawidia cretensis]MBT1711993.1 redoxin domain-containing protein [Dawidia cretensis]